MMRNFLLGLFLVILFAPSVRADEEAEKNEKTKSAPKPSAESHCEILVRP